MDFEARNSPKVDPKNLCRTCLSPLNLVELFPKNGVVSHIHQKYISVIISTKECYGIVISADDEYSTKMCETCIKMVKLFHTSRQYALSADCFLQTCCTIKTLTTPQPSSNHNEVSTVVQKLSSETLEQTANPEVCEEPSAANLHSGNSEERKLKNTQEKKEIGTTIDTKNILDPKSKRIKPKFKSGVKGSSAEFVARRKKMKQRMKSIQQKRENTKDLIYKRSQDRNDTVVTNFVVDSGQAKQKIKLENKKSGEEKKVSGGGKQKMKTVTGELKPKINSNGGEIKQKVKPIQEKGVSKKTTDVRKESGGSNSANNSPLLKRKSLVVRESPPKVKKSSMDLESISPVSASSSK